MVGGGLLINGLTVYAFITLASRDLGPQDYSPVGMLWVLSLLLGPGFFLPLEQETARAIASRLGRGVLPVVRAAAVIGGLTALCLALVTVVMGPWLVDRVFDGEGWLLVGLLLSLVGLGLAHLTKGVLAGLGRFGCYARYVVGEGLGRLLVVGVLVVVTSGGIGAYGMAIGLAPFVGIAVALVGQRGLASPGPPVELGDLSRALGPLLVASVSTLLVLNVSPLAVEFLAEPGQGDESGRFLNALLVARIPLFLFSAVRTPLLSQLSGLAGAARYGEMRRVLRRLLALVGLLGVLAVAIAALVGQWVIELAFGSGFAVDRRDMVLLAVSSAGLMVVLSLAQGLIACRSHGRMALAWLAGIVTFPLVILVGDDLFLRVEIGLIVTVFVTATSMAVLLVERIRHETATDSV